MGEKIGLWIDQWESKIFIIKNDNSDLKKIVSNIEKHVSASGGSRSTTLYGLQEVLAEDQIFRKYCHHLKRLEI